MPLGIATGPTRISIPSGARPGAGAVGAAGDRVGGVRVAVRVPPRPVLPGDRQLALDALVVRLEVPVGDRPVGADPVAACASRSPTGESAGCSRRSGPSSRRRRARSCSCPARRGPRRRSCVSPSSRCLWLPASSETQSRSGSQNGPDSRITTASRGGPGAEPAWCRPRRRRRSAGRPRRRRGRSPSWRGPGRRAGVDVEQEARVVVRGAARPWPAADRSSRHPRGATSWTGSSPNASTRLVGVGAGGPFAEAHVAARIGGAAEADLVPRPRVCVEGRRARRA